MKINEASGLVLAVVLLVITGACSSTPKPRLSREEIKHIDWSQRVGTYTWSDAITDLGPPDVTGDGSDGKLGEWIVSRRGRLGIGFGVGGGSIGGNSGVGVGVGSGISTPARGDFLRLKFDREGKLFEWSRVHY